MKFFRLLSMALFGLAAFLFSSSAKAGGFLICGPPFQKAALGQTVTFTAAGSQAPFRWQVIGGGSEPASGTGTVFRVRFTLPGFKSITVVGADGQNGGCTVEVLESELGATVSASPIPNGPSPTPLVTTKIFSDLFPTEDQDKLSEAGQTDTGSGISPFTIGAIVMIVGVLLFAKWVINKASE